MSPTEFLYRATKKIQTYVFQWLQREPITFTKIVGRDDLHEIGTKYGGWVVPKTLLNPDSICYCVGCGEDISFDLGLIEQCGSSVFAFDPTPRAIKHVREQAGDNERYHFSDIGLWDKEDYLKFYMPQNKEHVSHSLVNLQKTEDYIEVKVKRLKQVMEENHHQRIDLLKLDVEGAEYKILESVIEDNIDITIICVEYDECFNALDAHFKKRIQTSVNSLLAYGYQLAYVQDKGNYTFVKG